MTVGFEGLSVPFITNAGEMIKHEDDPISK